MPEDKPDPPDDPFPEGNDEHDMVFAHNETGGNAGGSDHWMSAIIPDDALELGLMGDTQPANLAAFEFLLYAMHHCGVSETCAQWWAGDPDDPSDAGRLGEFAMTVITAQSSIDGYKFNTVNQTARSLHGSEDESTNIRIGGTVSGGDEDD